VEVFFRLSVIAGFLTRFFSATVVDVEDDGVDGFSLIAVTSWVGTAGDDGTAAVGTVVEGMGGTAASREIHQQEQTK